MTAEEFNNALNLVGTNDEGFINIYNEYREGVFYSAYLILNNKERAKDITSTLFLKIYENARNYKYIANPKAWLYTLARNAAKDFLKTEVRYTGLEAACEIAATIEDSVETKIMFERILDELAFEDKEIIIKYGYFDYTLKEIAVDMNIPYNTVKSKYLRAMKKLKERLLKNKLK